MAFAREFSGRVPFGLVPMVQSLFRSETKSDLSSESKVKKILNSSKSSNEQFSRGQNFDRWKFSILFDNRKNKKVFFDLENSNIELSFIEKPGLGSSKDIYI